MLDIQKPLEPNIAKLFPKPPKRFSLQWWAALAGAAVIIAFSLFTAASQLPDFIALLKELW